MKKLIGVLTAIIILNSCGEEDTCCKRCTVGKA